MIEEILPATYIKITFSRDLEDVDLRRLRIEEINK